MTPWTLAQHVLTWYGELVPAPGGWFATTIKGRLHKRRAHEIDGNRVGRGIPSIFE